MSSHFRTAVLAIVLAGGTLASYMAAYAVMGAAPATASTAETATVARALPAGQTDISVKEACAVFKNAAARSRCSQEIAAPARAVRVIDFASTETGTAVR